MKKWMEERMNGWKKEKEELEKRIRNMEEEIKEYRKEKEEVKEDEGKGGKREEVGGEKKDRRWEEIGKRVKKMEIDGEKKEREERKRNVIIKGVKAKKEGWEGLREEVEEIVKETGAKVRIDEIKRVGRRNEEGKEIVMVRFASGEKIEVMKGKKNLKERNEWIRDDLTEKERRVEWKIRREAEGKRREGQRVRVGYMKMWVEGKLWRWDEEKDELIKGQEIGIRKEREEKEFF
ncbi:PREDICTED: protein PXR1-like [Vollenhovia emeryi]|uniref:protein PXR1-like n=1 Tax=Vollenhovia emeryi TaxID=411798 RepID=UPI0005F367C2|nr:PREDICTED: protein PXR1-like [Vollenhovia emeryi]